MESRSKNINSFWGYLLIEELVRNDITCFCISPGSRSTPLTIAAAENIQAEKIICYDERAAAYYALGYARATGKPAVLICTSGTAVANYFPAIVEAKNSQIPLIILTADRPPELRNTGANQTTDQVKMFGNYLKWQFDLPCPDLKIVPNFVLTTVDKAIHSANTNPGGPVHLNCMFREPLEPSAEDIPISYRESISDWQASEHAFTDYVKMTRSVDSKSVEDIVETINQTKNGIIVVGQLHKNSEKQAVIKFSESLQWPVFADITSGIRNNSHLKTLVNYFDQILLSDQFKENVKPEIIIHFGRPLTSKRYLKRIEDIKPSFYIHIDSGEERYDPIHIVTNRICGDPELICKQLIKDIGDRKDQSIIQTLNQADEQIDQILRSYSVAKNEISEISIPYLISQLIPEDHGLFLASSMPVRDFDMYGGLKINTSYIDSNRGVSGIDGTLATAVGYARGMKKRVTVVIGDIAMIHDLNSLSLVQNSPYPLTIVLVNNFGGGIFSFLPVSQVDHVFETYFAAPHPCKFEHAANLFDITYDNPSTNEDFIKLYKNSLTGNSSSLIEINTQRTQNYELHQELQHKIITSLEK